MEKVRARRVFVIDVVVDAATGRDGGVEAGGDPVDDLGCHLFSAGEFFESRRPGDHCASSVRTCVHRAHPLGDAVCELARGFHDLVELEVQVAEVGADDVPVRLLALQRQLDEVDQNCLQ